MWKEAAIEEAPQFRLSRPALPHVHAHRLLRRRRVYGVHQILAHSGQVRIDDPVDDTTAADLIEFVKRHFESFVVEFGHVCLLFGREGQSLNPWSGIRDCVLRGCAGRHTTKNGPPTVEN